jgi:hypothetical protein
LRRRRRRLWERKLLIDKSGEIRLHFRSQDEKLKQKEKERGLILILRVIFGTLS